MDTLLVGAQALQLEKIVQQPDGIALFASSQESVVTCPNCQAESDKPHSRYDRIVADLPWAGVALRLHLRVRKFFCLNSQCERHIFCERLPEVIQHYARRTDRLKDVLSQIGFALGGRPGARTANKLGMKTGADSILRQIRIAAA